MPKKALAPAKPTMGESLRQRADVAIAKHRGRFATPDLAVSGNWQDWDFDCPYGEEDRDRWDALLFEAFGTRSISTATVFLGQLSKLVGHGWDSTNENWRPEIEELNAAIGIVASVQPENESEAALAAQMVALHFTAMSLGARCANNGYPDERTAATLARVSRTYASLAVSLARLQGKVQPRSVHQTINVIYTDNRDQRQQSVGGEAFSGGQAQTNTPYRSNTLGQENAIVARSPKAVAIPALPSPRTNDRRAMQGASGEGQASLPDARWLARLWRTVRGR